MTAYKLLEKAFRPLNELPDNYSLRIVIRYKEFGLLGETCPHVACGYWSHIDHILISDNKQFMKFTPEYWMPVYDEI